MQDFTSSLYLGMTHPSGQLPGWSTLTTGRPAALGRPRVETTVARRLAWLTGTGAAVLRHSSLHALSDCLELLVAPAGAVHMDAGTYPIGQWAVQRSRGLGATVAQFVHHDPSALEASLHRHHGPGRPVVVADGFCVACGRQLPLAAYLEVARRHRARVLIDDTQSLGLLGSNPGRSCVLGHGGGGILANTAVADERVALVCSLAKAFGVPVAVVAGPTHLVRRIAREGGSATHASPPSAVDVLAAKAALDRNENEGELLRRRLSARVGELGAAAAESGLLLRGGNFPVQSTPPAPLEQALRLRDGLRAQGIRAVVTRGCSGAAASVTLIVTVEHGAQDVRRAGVLLGRLWRCTTMTDRQVV